jgi:hypothetical protein
MRNATSATHTPIVIKKANFAMFQTAILTRFPKCFALGGCNYERDIHTKHNQQRSGREGSVRKELEKNEGMLGVVACVHLKEGAHGYKGNPDLEIIVDHSMKSWMWDTGLT